MVILMDYHPQCWTISGEKFRFYVLACNKNVPGIGLREFKDSCHAKFTFSAFRL